MTGPERGNCMKMKKILILVDLVGGILVLLLGAAAVLTLMHSPLASIAGLVAVALAALWFWLTWESVSSGPSPAHWTGSQHINR